MWLFLLLLSLLSFTMDMCAQSLCDKADTSFTILHFTKTNGFNHNTRNESAAMFTEIGSDNQFTIVNTLDANAFNDSLDLFDYAVIIFSNTSGGSLFNSSQKANFEAYINNGGSFIGIHAASDTYRTGWPFYNNLLGAIVQTSPNHTSNSHTNFMDHHSTHEVLDGIPDPWQKTEEYYYWDLNGGMVDEDTIGTLLKVRETGNNSYDRERPITWLRTFASGARSFYTALGHARSNFTSDTEFKQLLSNAVCWAAYDKGSFQQSGPSIQVENSQLSFSNANGGIIMKSGNGACYKLTVGNDGQLYTRPCACLD